MPGNVTVSMISRGHSGCSETRNVVVSVSVMQAAQARQLRECYLESLTYAIVYLASQRVAPQVTLFFLLFFFHLTYSRWTSSLPSCLWSQRIFPSLPGSRLTISLSRYMFSTLTTRQPMVELYLLTFPRFPLRKKEHKSYFGTNRTHDFRTSRCAAYLLDHSGDDTHLKSLLFVIVFSIALLLSSSPPWRGWVTGAK